MPRELLSGNEAVARGAWEAGVTFAAAYPGTPSTEILENISHYRDDIYCMWGSNEKTAMESALGASFTGARALVAMKHVGLNVAADPFFSAAYIGSTGGLIIVSADDPGMHSSQNEQDNRLYGVAAKMPVFEPSDSQETRDMVVEGIRVSEEYDVPLLLRMTTRTSHSRSGVETGERSTPPEIDYQKDFAKRCLLPANARKRHQDLEMRLEKLAAYSSACPFNRILPGRERIGVIASGISFQHGREVFPDAWFLKVGMPFPFPDKLCREFLEKVDTVYVLEENEPLLENFVRLLAPQKKIFGKDLFPRCGEMTPDVIAACLAGQNLPAEPEYPAAVRRPPTLCAGCGHRSVFYNLSRLKLTVTGDIGCYTLGGLAPLNAMDLCVDMGASITTLLGMEKALEKGGLTPRQLAVIGDSTFFHSGLTGLLDIIFNNGKSTVLILDNSITAMTGHQDNPGSGRNLMGQPAPRVDIAKLVRDGLGIEHTYEIDAYRVKEMRELLKDEIARPAPSVIVVRRPCMLLFRKAVWSPMLVKSDVCTACRACLRVGCPALTAGPDGQATIVGALCTGCTICAQVCPFQAIVFQDEKGNHAINSSLNGNRPGGAK